MDNKQTKALLNENEAGEFLRISRKTLRDWRYLGKHLPFVKIGGSVRYRLRDLNEFVERSTRPVE